MGSARGLLLTDQLLTPVTDADVVVLHAFGLAGPLPAGGRDFHVPELLLAGLALFFHSNDFVRSHIHRLPFTRTPTLTRRHIQRDAFESRLLNPMCK